MKLSRILSVAGVAAVLLGATIVPGQASSATAAAKATCDGKKATIVGTSGNDTIIGTTGNDIIAGLAGDDTILGLGGNDIICGGDGNDVITPMKGDGSSQPIFGGGGTDLCAYPHQDSSSVRSCEADPQPQALNSDPPSGGTSKGSVLRAQSVATGASCKGSDGQLTFKISGKVSADLDQRGKILFEPFLFTYSRTQGTWNMSDLPVHTRTIPGYNGKWNKFAYSMSTPGKVKGTYFLGYYIQWYQSDGSSIDGNLWTFVYNYPQQLKGSTYNTNLCLPQFG